MPSPYSSRTASSLAQKWQEYSDIPGTQLPETLFYQIVTEVTGHISTINLIFAEEYQPHALYIFRTILTTNDEEAFTTLLLNPFRSLAKQDKNMLLIVSAMQPLYALCAQDPALIDEYNFIEFGAVSDLAVIGLLEEIAIITRAELKQAALSIKERGINIPDILRKKKRRS